MLFLSFLGEFSVDLARSQVQTHESILTTGDVPPERPPKPYRLMTQDSAYDSGGSKESVSLEHDNAFDGERYIDCIKGINIVN